MDTITATNKGPVLLKQTKTRAQYRRLFWAYLRNQNEAWAFASEIGIILPRFGERRKIQTNREHKNRT